MVFAQHRRVWWSLKKHRCEFGDRGSTGRQRATASWSKTRRGPVLRPSLGSEGQSTPRLVNGRTVGSPADLSGEPTAGRVGLPYPARPAPLTFAKWFPCTAVIRKGRILASSQLELRTQVCHAAVALDPVAVTAEKLEVVWSIGPAFQPCDDVVYLQVPSLEVVFTSSTVPALPRRTASSGSPDCCSA